MDFIAVDFETANSKRSSACSIGLAYVENSTITNTEYHLIKPTPFEFSPFNTRIHGITEDSVKDAPSIHEILDKYIPDISNKTVIAHNASFEISVIKSAYDLVDLSYPYIEYLCTYRLAKVLLPNLGCYRLDYLCHYFGIQLKHHDALADSIACAELLLRLVNIANCISLDELLDKTQFQIGELGLWGYTLCACANQPNATPRAKRYGVDEINNLEVQYLDNDFAGKYFCFTGTLLSMPRERALELVSIAGGIAQKGVTKQTNYLVCGHQDEFSLRGKKTSNKFEKALTLAERGHDIQIIQEEDFLNLADSELWDVFCNNKPFRNTEVAE